MAEPVVIVGLGGVFPGASSPDAFWQLVRTGGDSVTAPGPDRWPVTPHCSPDAHPGPDEVSSYRACLIRDWQFSGAGLALAPALAPGLDPMYQLLLDAGRAAWQDCRSQGLERGRVGVVVGNIVLPTEQSSRYSSHFLAPKHCRTPPDVLNRHVAGLPAGLLARALGLGAGAWTLDAACASSLYALKYAADALRSGRADMMLTGGLARPDCLYTQMGFSQLQALSRSGRCSPFDYKADGLVVGEGCGVLALKRLADALADGDRIYATVAGIGLGNDIAGNLMQPDSEGQLRTLRAAYRQAGWRPDSVQHIECHGTGTPVGDAVEFASLQALWDGQDRGAAVLGSVKGNVGHLLTAAGAASLVKSCLAIQHRTLPPTAHFERPPPAIALQDSPFEVLCAAREWPRPADTPRRAAVSGFGFGGVNAHVLLEEYCTAPARARFAGPRPDDEAASARARPRLAGASGGMRGAVDDEAASARARPRSPEAPAIAIVGMAARVGSADSTEALLRVLFHAPARDRSINACGPLRIPVGRYPTPPKELEEALPQQLLMLEAAREALAEAGLVRLDEAQRLRTGVFVGVGLDLNACNFHLRWLWRYGAGAASAGSEPPEPPEPPFPPLTANRTMGALGSIVASRIARAFSIAGPSFTVSSEETSGLQALELAAAALRARELDQVLVGAVDLPSDPRARPRRGTVHDAAIAFVLRRAEDAREAGQPVHALLRGVGQISAAPLRPDQAPGAPGADSPALAPTLGPALAPTLGPALAPALAAAGLSCDPAAASVLQRPGEYAGAATALLGVLRAVLALRHRLLPDGPEGGARYWLWDRARGPRQALVCTASLAGNLGVAELQEEETAVISPRCLAAATPLRLFLLAAECGAALRRQLAELHFSTPPPRPGSGPQGPQRAALLAADEAGLRAASARLQEAIGQDRALCARDCWYAPEPAPGGELAFVFPGFGNHFFDMGRTLGAAFPAVLERQHRENLYLARQFGAGCFWRADRAEEPGERDILFIQVSLGVFISDVLAAFGVRPQAVIGYSLGETTGLFATRAWRQRDEMLRRMHASGLFVDQLSGPCLAAQRSWGVSGPVQWLTGVVRLPAPVLRRALGRHPRVYLLLINAPDECVVGGEKESVLACLRELGAALRHVLPGVVTVHCEVAGQVEADYRALHLFDDTRPAPGIRYYSASAGRAHAPDRWQAAQSITRAALGALDFVRLIETAWQDGVRMFLEPGPGSSCSRMIRRILGDRPHQTLSICTPRGRDLQALFSALGRLHCHGLEIDRQYLAGLWPMSPPVRTAPVVTVAAPALPAIPVSLPGLPGAGAGAPASDGNTGPGGSGLGDSGPGGSGAGIGAPPPDADTAPAVSGAPSSAASGAPSSAVSGASPSAASGAPSSAVSGASPSAVSGAPSSAVSGAPSSAVSGAPPSAASAAPPSAVSGAPPSAASRPHPVLARMQTAAAALASAEESFLRLQAGLGRSLSEARVLQARQAAASPRQPVQPMAFPWPRRHCLEFAAGRIAAVFGPDFADIDGFPTRVRLPAEPLMLVDRVLRVEAEVNALGRGQDARGCIVTEHLVRPGAWYLDGGRIPTCIAVEAGQADLLLSAWLGIDHRTRGEAVYRLLDAAVQFHAPLPGPGDTIRYTIHIEEFFRQGQTWLFRFHFEAAVHGRAVLSMSEGCAGFFTPAELASGQGIVARTEPPPDRPPLIQGRTAEPLAPMAPESIDEQGLAALRAGDLAACFGPAFAGLPWPRTQGLPDGRMALVRRIILLDPRGGRYGRGYIKGEADIDPQDWFLTCHFVDDQVMPGTLMYECCLHTLRVFLLRMGWLGAAGDCVYEPIPGILSRLKCRGQVTPATRSVQYEVTIRELAYQSDGTPCAVADALMHADHHPIVQIRDMSVRISGLRREQLLALWRGRAPAPRRPAPAALFDKASILAFAEGNPSEAFGAPYQVFDRQRRIARLPRPPYQFLDRITAIEGCVQWQMRAGGYIEAEYEAPRDAWYFAAERQPRMPFAVLLEVALQACGWLAAYLGSALHSEEDLSFRNLGGRAVQHRAVGPDSGVLRSCVSMTRVSQSGGMIIQHYRYAVRDREGLLYAGDTYFGFFPQAALQNQRGIADACLHRPGAGERARAEAFPYPDAAPLPGEPLRMVDEIVHLDPQGGEKGLGLIQARTRVRPQQWFFAAHFHQDPVWPGSLGLESLLQLMKVHALRCFPGPVRTFQCMAPGQPHAWTYRGQITPDDGEVLIEAVITRVDAGRRQLWANGQLAVDGRLIYRMEDFCLRAGAD